MHKVTLIFWVVNPKNLKEFTNFECFNLGAQLVTEEYSLLSFPSLDKLEFDGVKILLVIFSIKNLNKSYFVQM